jgi:hypothetical protein
MFFGHIKNFHDCLKLNNTFKCPFQCPPIFTNFTNFKKHVKKHSINDNNIETVIPNVLSSVSTSSNYSPNWSDKSDIELESFDQNEFVSNPEIIENQKKLLHSNLLEFLTKYHGKNHLTKKLIEEIFNDINDLIIEPFIESIQELVPLENKEAISNSKQIFKNIKTFHKFEKNLKEQNLLCDVQQVALDTYVGNFEMDILYWEMLKKK